MSKMKFAKQEFKKLPFIKHNAVSLSQADLVKTGYLEPGRKLPLVIEPSLPGVDLSAWVSSNQQFIRSNLFEHGGILFRGFGLSTKADFESFVGTAPWPLMHYIEGATPRTELGDKVYTSTEYPADQAIALHNELTYVTTWPLKIWFFCMTPAQEGGETPIADVRRVYQRLSPKTVERFKAKGWMLVRNYGAGLSLDWQKAFRTDDREELEEYCHKAGIQYEWKGEDRLKTQQVRPALAKHPYTGETVWFNHVAFWHITSLEKDVRKAMGEMFKPEDLPYNTYYGDGEMIELGVMEELREAYREEKIAFQWQRNDLLMLDNMLVAHGRNPYKGERKVLVAMGEPCSDRGW